MTVEWVADGRRILTVSGDYVGTMVNARVAKLDVARHNASLPVEGN